MGGGGGGAWQTWAYFGGMPGTGGQCVCYKNIKLNYNDNIEIIIGAGGSKATFRTGGVKRSGDGGSTRLTHFINGSVSNQITYTANGGIGGINGFSESGIPTDERGAKWSWFINNYGTEQWFANGKYYNGSFFSLWNSDMTVLDYYITSKGYQTFLESNNPPYSRNNALYIKKTLGVPEFFEDGQPMCAMPGIMESHLVLQTEYGPDVSYYDSSYDTSRWYTSEGYGAGGLGGSYGSGNNYGQNGNSGVAVIRFYK